MSTVEVRIDASPVARLLNEVVSRPSLRAELAEIGKSLEFLESDIRHAAAVAVGDDRPSPGQIRRERRKTQRATSVSLPLVILWQGDGRKVVRA